LVLHESERDARLFRGTAGTESSISRFVGSGSGLAENDDAGVNRRKKLIRMEAEKV